MAKPNHQPFEEWLLSEASLTFEEERQLQAHLQACVACRQLSLALRQVEHTLRHAPVLAPADGFVARWERRLEAEYRRQHQRQTRWMLAFSLGGAMLLLALVLILVLPVLQQPLPFLLAWIYHLMLVWAVINATGEALSTLVRALIVALPPLAWVGLVGASTLLGVLWLATLQRLITWRRMIQ